MLRSPNSQPLRTKQHETPLPLLRLFLQESAGVAPAFLDAMVARAGSPAEVALWEGVLRDSFGALSNFSFLDADKAEGIMKRWADCVCGCVWTCQGGIAWLIP